MRARVDVRIFSRRERIFGSRAGESEAARLAFVAKSLSNLLILRDEQDASFVIQRSFSDTREFCKFRRLAETIEEEKQFGTRMRRIPEVLHYVSPWRAPFY